MSNYESRSAGEITADAGRDASLVEVLTSDVTQSWSRTCRAVLVLAAWRLGWWPAAVPVVIVWLLR